MRLRPMKVYTLFKHRDRHLAEWRSLLFTVIVIVYPKIWNVNVIGIETPPFGWCSGTAFFRLTTPYPFGQSNFTEYDNLCQ